MSHSDGDSRKLIAPPVPETVLSLTVTLLRKLYKGHGMRQEGDYQYVDGG